MRVAVVGLGRIGLPLAARFASKGASVIGCDLNPAVIEAVNSGSSPVGGEPGLEELVREGHVAGSLTATSDTSAAVSESDVVVVIVRVGTSSANQTDFAQLDAAAAQIGRGLKRETLVILESTVPVGVTRGRFRENLASASGHDPGAIRLAYSPERVVPITQRAPQLVLAAAREASPAEQSRCSQPLTGEGKEPNPAPRIQHCASGAAGEDPPRSHTRHPAAIRLIPEVLEDW